MEIITILLIAVLGLTSGYCYGTYREHMRIDDEAQLSIRDMLNFDSEAYDKEIDDKLEYAKPDKKKK